ncbi:MAG: preprotein translocase subunit SecE [Patescibacteria group bacterium]|nr:preprotein translocase subunit SecE [Patescibacteria group bacterium]
MSQPTAKTEGPRALVTDIVEELRKVTWPTRKDTINLTIVVIVISLLIGAYIGIIDVLLTWGLELLTK